MSGSLMASWLAMAAALAGPAELILQERFDGQCLDEKVWRVTRKHDFQDWKVEVAGGRLRLLAATIGTRPETVKWLGVCTRQAVVDLSRPIEVEFELDWNRQRNGCYLTAGLYLCPTSSDAPKEESDWLKVEYIGVPPGRNGRCELASRVAGRLHLLYTEGWPVEQRTGRPIGVQKVKLTIRDGGLALRENGRLLFELPRLALGFKKAYLYLQMSSHSNYPPRAVFFDNVVVRRLE